MVTYQSPSKPPVQFLGSTIGQGIANFGQAGKVVRHHFLSWKGNAVQAQADPASGVQ
jgi:hypothetical protein